MNNDFTSFGGGNQGGFAAGSAFSAEQAQKPQQFTSGIITGVDSLGSPLTGSLGGTNLAAVHPFANDAQQPLAGPRFDTTLATGINKPTKLDQGAITSVRVISCNFCEMVEQQTMGFRPFVSNVTDSDVLKQIPQFVREQRNGANFRSQSMNPIVNEIVSLSANTLGQIPLVNGWNIKRYSFTIMAEVVTSTGSVKQYMIEGFTDTPEISTHDGVLPDRNMVLHVNNVVSFAQRSNLINGSLSMVPIENYNVISSSAMAQGVSTKHFMTQRPYDVANMSLNGLLAGNTSNHVFDVRSSISSDTKTSSLSNNNPATYASKIINDSIRAIDSSNTDNVYNTTTVRNMVDTLAEPSLAKNGFLHMLTLHATGFSTPTSCFTWADLCGLDQALNNRHCQYLNVFTAHNRPGFLPSSGFMCDDISGSGHEQVFAQMIANCVADLMGRCEATLVSVVASNHSGVDDAEVTSMQCYDDTKVPINTGVFKQCFLANVMQMLNVNTQFSYNVAVSASLWGETFVKINLGYGTSSFLFPNFANSVWSPVLTNNQAHAVDVSRHLLSVANTINNEQYKLRKESQPQGVSSTI